MKRLLYVLPLALIMGACSGEKTDSETSTDDNMETTTMQSGDEENKQEAESAKELTAEEKFVTTITGEWMCPAEIAGIQVDLSIKEDGTMSQDLGPNNISGRYNALAGDKLEILNDEGDAFQTWEIRNVTANSMDVCWNPEAAKPKVIPFKRK